MLRHRLYLKASIALVALTTLGYSAFAADLPMKAPPPAVVVVSDWSDF
jgi:hypothetical protein